MTWPDRSRRTIWKWKYGVIDRLTVEVQGIPYENIEAFQAYIAKAGLQTGGTGAKVRPIVSCKGTTCQYGLLDSFALSEEIHHRFYEGYHGVALPHKFKIAVGGCPNNCVKPDLNDLGIIGQRIPNFDKSRCKGCKKMRVAAACPIGASKVVDGILHRDEESVITAVGASAIADSIRSQTDSTASRFTSAAAGASR